MYFELYLPSLTTPAIAYLHLQIQKPWLGCSKSDKVTSLPRVLACIAGARVIQVAQCWATREASEKYITRAASACYAGYKVN